MLHSCYLGEKPCPAAARPGAVCGKMSGGSNGLLRRLLLNLNRSGLLHSTIRIKRVRPVGMRDWKNIDESEDETENREPVADVPESDGQDEIDGGTAQTGSDFRPPARTRPLDIHACPSDTEPFYRNVIITGDQDMTEFVSQHA